MEARPRSLIVFNYAMDSRNPIFSHQIEVVRRLAPSFEKVLVITNSFSKNERLPGNVTIKELFWRPGQNFLNALKFLICFFGNIRDFPSPIIFSHMTEVQSSLVAIWTYFRGIRHFLWYAHVSKSKYLLFCHIFVTGIITSTKGSCPISSQKIYTIGQAIDINKFPKLTTVDRLDVSSIRAVTVGRVDPSKRVDQLLAFVCKSEYSQNFRHFKIIGKASVGNEAYEEKLKWIYREEISSRKIEFSGALPREDISPLLDHNDLFIHAFQGSLDKTLVEAIISGLPVITINKECHIQFGTWSNNLTKPVTLHDEFENFIKTPLDEISRLCDERRKIAIDNHSLDQWILKLCALLGEI